MGDFRSGSARPIVTTTTSGSGYWVPSRDLVSRSCAGHRPRTARYCGLPSRSAVPTMQLLHCLSNAVAGGESGLVDGFRAAALLRTEDQAAFRILTATPVPFGWSDAGASLRAERPLIETDARGRIREVRFNNRSMQTLRLEPGDCLIFDNVRLLHARTAFADSGSGSRHLQGCYADLDGLNSTVTILGAGS